MVATLLMPMPEAFAEDGAEVNWFYGFSGRSRNDCWTPVLLEVPPGVAGGNFDGFAWIEPSSGSQRGRFRQPVVLTAAEEGSERVGRADRFWLYVRPGPGTFRGTAFLEGERRQTLFAREPMGRSSLLEDGLVVLVAGPSLGVEAIVESEARLADGTEYHPFRDDYDVARCSVARLPDRAIGYDGVDVLVLVNPVVGRRLRDEQLAAVSDFVETGGRLVLFVNRHWQQLQRSRLADILPADLGPLAPLTDLRGLRRLPGPEAPPIPGRLSAPTMRVKPGGSVLVSAGGKPLVAERLAGTGRVTLVGLDASSPALRQWSGLPGLVSGLLRLQPAPPPRANLLGSAVCGEAPRRYTRPRGVFGSAAFFWAVLLLTILYILLVGPVLHLLLKKLRRLDLSWPAYLSLGLVAAGACFGVVSAVRNRAVVTSTFTVVDYPADGRAAVGRSWHAIRFPNSSLYQVALEASRGHLALESPSELPVAVLGSGGRVFDYAPTLLAVEDLPVKSNQFRYFEAQWRHEGTAPMAARLRQTRTGAAGTLEVEQGPVRRTVVVGPKRVVELGRLGSGQTVRLGRGRATFPLAEYLRKLAEETAGEDSLVPFGGMPRAGATGEESATASHAEVFREVCLSTFFERYRRSPLEAEDERRSRGLNRNALARRLDLSHVLEAGYAVVIGEAEPDVPDGVTVAGRAPDDLKRLVIFRQVVPLGGAGGGP